MHLPVRRSRPTTAYEENRQRNTHAGVYRYTVKCALRKHVPRSTLRSLIYTPRGSYPCDVLVLSSSVVVSKRPKTKRDNAFSICSALPCRSILLKGHHGHYGQLASAKVQKTLELCTVVGKKIKIWPKIWRITGKCLYLQRQNIALAIRAESREGKPYTSLPNL